MLAAIGDGGVCTINALSPSVHRGEAATNYGRKGHIAGSRNVPYAALLNPDGTYRDDASAARTVRGGRRADAAAGDLLLRRRHLGDDGRVGADPPRPPGRRRLRRLDVGMEPRPGHADGGRRRVMKDELVLSAIDGPIARLTLNAPDRANVLSSAMMGALGEALAAAAADKDVRVVVLGAAGRIFCAGHDLEELRDGVKGPRREALFAQCSTLMMAIGACRAPVIARVQGAAVAAGCQLVASCDLAYASTTAKFAVPGINLGLFCSTPGVAVGRSIGRKAALELLLTGEAVDAARAAALGLINRAVPVEELDAVVDATARVIAAKPPDAVALGKTAFGRQIEAPLAQAYEIASRAMLENLAFPSTQDGIETFLSR